MKMGIAAQQMMPAALEQLKANKTVSPDQIRCEHLKKAAVLALYWAAFYTAYLSDERIVGDWQKALLTACYLDRQRRHISARRRELLKKLRLESTLSHTLRASLRSSGYSRHNPA